MTIGSVCRIVSKEYTNNIWKKLTDRERKIYIFKNNISWKMQYEKDYDSNRLYKITDENDILNIIGSHKWIQEKIREIENQIKIKNQLIEKDNEMKFPPPLGAGYHDSKRLS